MPLTFDRETLEAVHALAAPPVSVKVMGTYIMHQWADLDALEIITARTLWKREF